MALRGCLLCTLGVGRLWSLPSDTLDGTPGLPGTQSGTWPKLQLASSMEAMANVTKNATRGASAPPMHGYDQPAQSAINASLLQAPTARDHPALEDTIWEAVYGLWPDLEYKESGICFDNGAESAPRIDG